MRVKKETTKICFSKSGEIQTHLLERIGYRKTCCTFDSVIKFAKVYALAGRMDALG